MGTPGISSNPIRWEWRGWQLFNYYFYESTKRDSGSSRNFNYECGIRYYYYLIKSENDGAAVHLFRDYVLHQPYCSSSYMRATDDEPKSHFYMVYIIFTAYKRELLYHTMHIVLKILLVLKDLLSFCSLNDNIIRINIDILISNSMINYHSIMIIN